MRTLRTSLAAASIALAVPLLAACSGGDTETAPPSTSTASEPGGSTTTTAGGSSAPDTTRPTPVDIAAVDTTNPEAVAEATAQCSLQWDTAVDVNEYDAARRAAALMTPELAATFTATDQARNADPTWAKMRTEQAYSVPALYSAQPTHDAPPDTVSTVYRTYEATWTWVSASGKASTDPRTRYLYLTVSQQPDGRWLVSTFDVTDV